MAGVGNRIHPDTKPHEYCPLMNIGYCPGILALDFAPGQIGFAGIAVDTLHIGFHRDILDIWSISGRLR